MDSMIDAEPIEYQLNDEPSLSEIEQEPSLKQPSLNEPKECALPMISISPQHTSNRSKISFLPSISTYGEVLSFIDYLDTWPPIVLKLTYFVTGLLRVVDYATLHGRKPFFEHLPQNNFILL